MSFKYNFRIEESFVFLCFTFGFPSVRQWNINDTGTIDGWILKSFLYQHMDICDSIPISITYMTVVS